MAYKKEAANNSEYGTYIFVFLAFRRAARENFNILSVALTQKAAYEPALHSTTEDVEEGMSIN